MSSRWYRTRPEAAACPPVPYPAHTATVVCRGGTQSGNSPENIEKYYINKSVTQHSVKPALKTQIFLYLPSAPKGKIHILISVNTQSRTGFRTQHAWQHKLVQRRLQRKHMAASYRDNLLTKQIQNA